MCRPWWFRNGNRRSYPRSNAESRCPAEYANGLGAGTALILGASYTLWMYKRVYLGPVANDDVRGLSDINSREFLVLALLAIAVLYMGIYPKPFTDVMDASVAELLKHVAQSKLH